MTAREPDERPPSAGEVASRAAALALDPWDPRAATTVIASRRTDAEAAQDSRPGPPWLRSRRTLIGAAVLVAAVASSVFVAARPAVHRVPDLRGMPYAAAARTLHEQGLDEVTRTYVDDPGTERGTVLGQDPSPGAGAEDGEAVTLELASGSVRLRPAGLVGDGYVEAAREVVELGLVPRRGEVARAEGAGTVVDVGAAGRLTLGSLVTLTVAVAPEPAPAPVPRVRGDAGRGGARHLTPARQRRPERRAGDGTGARAPRAEDRREEARPREGGQAREVREGAREEEVSRAGRGRLRRPRAPGRTSPGSP